MTSRRTPAVSPLPVWAGGLGALALCFLILPLAFMLGRVNWSTLGATLATPEARDALGLSLRTCLMGLGVDLVLGVPAALVLSRSWRGVRAARILVALPLSLPPVVAGIALLAAFGRRYPQRCFDVGIAEQHAVTSAAGLAAGGMKPVVAVYSSFLQRGFDQVLHDVCIQNLPVVFAIDRAGLVGADGETHQGVFDLSYLGCIPNMTILAPKNCFELEEELRFAFSYGGPIAIRYPRGKAYRGLAEFREPIRFGKAELLFREEKTALLALGSMVSTAEHVREKLKALGQPCTLVNMRFAKPIDKELLAELAETHENFVTLEENVLRGGFGLEVAEWASSQKKELSVTHIALPDAYVEHGDVSVLREHLGIDSDSVVAVLRDKYHW